MHVSCRGLILGDIAYLSGGNKQNYGRHPLVKPVCGPKFEINTTRILTRALLAGSRCLALHVSNILRVNTTERRRKVIGVLWY
jgi:hypothetical protein